MKLIQKVLSFFQSNKTPILETKRLILRPWKREDARFLYEFAKDPRVGPSCGWKVHRSIDDSIQTIQQVFSLNYIFAIVPKTIGYPVGCISIVLGSDSNLRIPDDEGEIGFWIGVPFWGQGLIPEATREIIRFGKKDLKLKKIWCGYFEGNDKSKRVQEKCGFELAYTRENIYWDSLGEYVTENVTLLKENEK